MPTYSLDELMKQMEPQSRRDKALIARCIDGIGLYAAQLAAENGFSPKLKELRELAGTLVSYWGLDQGENAPRAESLLRAFDERVWDAGTGGKVDIDVLQTGANVIFGLHRFGMEMIVAQGDSAIGDIMSVSALMKEIAAAWQFEPGLLNDLTTRLETEAWGLLPGQRTTGRTEQGYDIKQAVVFNDNQGFALAYRTDGQGFTTAENPDQPMPFVVWQFLLKGDTPDFHWLKFMGSESGAMEAYQKCADDHAAERGAEPVTMSAAWVCGKTERPTNIEVYIVNGSTGEPAGEWLILPTDADTLAMALERVGVNLLEHDFSIADIRLPFNGMEDYIGKYDNLNELNMLAAHIRDTPDYGLETLQAILSSGNHNIGEGSAALINVLYEDNLNSFYLIDANNYEELGRYYHSENGEVPDGVSFEEYGRETSKAEGGSFTPWGYVYRSHDLSPEYLGYVPDEYRIVEKARQINRSKVDERRADERPSVVDQIRAARSVPREQREQPPRHKSKGGPEL